MATLDLTGRILFLCEDPQRVERQLDGLDLTEATAGTLRDDVSTDEITPMSVLTRFDERLGRFPYLGFRTGGRNPIGADAIRNGRFCVTVAGNRYGKGSSREHSPLAEYRAGIRLVIAKSFERIYRQNADNLGLFTSTDFGLIDRIRRGEPIDIEELVASRDALSASILRSGGLLRYGARHMRHIEAADRAAHGEPRTLAQKIIERHALRTEGTGASLAPGSGIFVRADWRFIHEYYTGMATHMLHATFGKPLSLHQPDTILAFEDHLSYSHKSALHIRNGLLPDVNELSAAHRQFAQDHGLKNHGYLSEVDGSFSEGSEGISHAMMAERYALPGHLIVGTDSHTPHSGALGCVAFGVGTTDMANAFVTGAVRMTVPQSLRVDFNGSIPAGVTAKDLVLHLLADPRIRAGAGVGKVFEFAGSAIAQLTTDERTTLTNMTAELGGLTGIVAPDEETVRFLKARRGVDFVIEPWMRSDAGASYTDVIEIDCAGITPMLASPGDPGNGIALRDLAERPRVDIAYGGSCTAGKREDFDHYHEVLAWAAARGLRVPSNVKLYLQFGTSDVRDYCVQRGYIDAFEQAGAILLQPSCGACANCGPGASVDASQVTISAINRNFPGRSGPGQVWLASPPTVVASALAGHIASFDELKARAQRA
ncbi:aconitase family protein [Paraburkholderia diazotrophica]|uniref:3-isopropylmalate/(R)-2-methylmalate dehydratase large subunit n=1 Tax=Paraburkholderia diazotrophica TaxID=667676 RepID=A0A1H6Y4P8_9BURK|nr:aconitase family protein [Paraburkholderia diazotrophica]SEJ31765.1 3-isopropylmalate/(R)-2-methylmalate dehydratase large subunit [Paraburkholderia diazotrophica]